MRILENVPWYPDKDKFPHATMRRAAKAVWWFAIFVYGGAFVIGVGWLISQIQADFIRSDTMVAPEKLMIPWLDICEDTLHGGRSNPSEPSLLEFLDAHLWAYIDNKDYYAQCVGEGRGQLYNSSYYRTLTSEKQECSIEYYQYGFGVAKASKGSPRVLRDADLEEAKRMNGTLTRFRCKRFGVPAIEMNNSASFDLTVSLSLGLQNETLKAMLDNHAVDFPNDQRRVHQFSQLVMGFMVRWSSRETKAMNMSFDPEPLKGLYIPKYGVNQIRDARSRGYHHQVLWRNAFGFETGENYTIFHPEQFVALGLKKGWDKVGKIIFKLFLSDFNIHITTYKDEFLSEFSFFLIAVVTLSKIFQWLMDGIFKDAKPLQKKYRYGVMDSAASSIFSRGWCWCFGCGSLLCGDDSDSEDDAADDAAETEPLRPKQQ